VTEKGRSPKIRKSEKSSYILIHQNLIEGALQAPKGSKDALTPILYVLCEVIEQWSALGRRARARPRSLPGPMGGPGLEAR
jgi:hypothetical protein